MPSDALKRSFLHRLRIDTDARHPICLHRCDLRRAHAVGTSCLHRELTDRRSIESIIYHFEHFGKKNIGQARRRPSPDVDTPDGQPQCAHILCGSGKIAREHIHKCTQRILPRQEMRRKGTVEAARKAERNADVDPHRPRILMREKRQLTHGDLRQEACLLRAAEIILLQSLHGSVGRHTAPQPAVHNLRRTHPVQDAPRGRRQSKTNTEKLVEIPLDRAVHRCTRQFIRAPRRGERKALTAPVQRIEPDLRHNRRRLTARRPVHHRQLGVIRLSCFSDDLHLEEVQHLMHNLDDDLAGMIDGERSYFHAFFCFSRHFLQMPKNFA